MENIECAWKKSNINEKVIQILEQALQYWQMGLSFCNIQMCQKISHSEALQYQCKITKSVHASKDY